MINNVMNQSDLEAIASTRNRREARENKRKQVVTHLFGGFGGASFYTKQRVQFSKTKAIEDYFRHSVLHRSM